jgi:hypothetical protein
MKNLGKVISFRDNVSNRHGEVFRSSSIFYIPPSEKVKTTISILNYWRLKRDIDVAIIASVRGMDGVLIDRCRLRFKDGQVINFCPAVQSKFEGSVEIEVFASENLVIPYAAIIAWYETKMGLSLVHSYSRAYSNHEIEEGRSLDLGREGCWSIFDDDATRSFAIVHNGAVKVSEQRVVLRVINNIGEIAVAEWLLPPLNPFQSIRIEPSRHIDGLVSFLDGQMGQAEIDFTLGGSFSRMLVGNERLDQSDLQVTHSNFNYTLQSTDMAGSDAVGWMLVPDISPLDVEVVIYPQSVRGAYSVEDDLGARRTFTNGQFKTFTPQTPTSLRFESATGDFPTRLVTALRIRGIGDRLSCECSLGVLTNLQPPKRYWWGPLRCDDDATSILIVHDLPQIFGPIPHGSELILKIYSATQMGSHQIVLSGTQISTLARGVVISDIWLDARKFLGGEPGYYTIFCEYGGLTVYTLTKNHAGSISLEHGF